MAISARMERGDLFPQAAAADGGVVAVLRAAGQDGRRGRRAAAAVKFEGVRRALSTIAQAFKDELNWRRT
jgi:hypothetical protein